MSPYLIAYFVLEIIGLVLMIGFACQKKGAASFGDIIIGLACGPFITAFAVFVLFVLTIYIVVGKFLLGMVVWSSLKFAWRAFKWAFCRPVVGAVEVAADNTVVANICDKIGTGIERAFKFLFGWVGKGVLSCDHDALGWTVGSAMENLFNWLKRVAD